MRDLAERFLKSEHKEKFWRNDPTAAELYRYAFDHLPWDENRLDKIVGIRQKSIADLSLPEVIIYLTTVIGRERVSEGVFDCMIQNGTVSSLLERYLGLTDGDQQKSNP